MKYFALLLFLSPVFLNAQVADDCSGATALCAGSPVSGTTSGAVAECGGADGDCLSSGSWGQCNDVNNSVWLTFTTNQNGGAAQLDFSGISCSTGNGIDIVVLEASTPCDPSTYNGIYCSENDSGSASVNLTGLSSNTTYYIQVDGSAPPGSTGDCDFEITVTGPAVTPEIYTSSTPSDCQTPTGTVTIDSISGLPGPYTYQIAGANDADGSMNGLPVGNVPITVSGSNGCMVNSSAFIGEQNNQLNVEAGEGATLVPGSQYTLGGDGNGTTFTWSPAISLSDSTDPNAVFTAGAPGVFTYTLTTTSAAGCQASDDVVIIVLPPLVVFNGFSPNGDGINDTWEIRNAERYPDILVSVFSRWGQRIFHQEGYDNLQNPWDGTSMGALLPAGVYYYAIDLNSGYSNDKKSERYTGSITILK